MPLNFDRKRMENWVKSSTDFFESYVNSFTGLSAEQDNNFKIKKEHSLRVADNSKLLSGILNLSEEDEKIAVLAATFHDIGRFRQLIEYDTFNDLVSLDHADFALDILKEEKILSQYTDSIQELIYVAIKFHNKFALPKKLSERELLHAQLLRDADKLDILKVVTDYYSDKNQAPNHTLTWNLPKATQASPGVAKDVLAGKLVSKDEVKSETDVKIMQLSWVYDLNFKPTIELVFQNRFLEKIYNTLPKNDAIIEIYRKVKVYAENKLME